LNKEKGMNRLHYFLYISIALLGLTACHQERNQSIRLMNEGIKANKAGRDSVAIEKLREAAIADPTNGWASFYLAGILDKSASNPQGFEEAVKAYQQAIEAIPTEFIFRYYLATCYAKQEENQLVIDTLLKAIPLKTKGKSVVTLGSVYYRLGQAYEQLSQYDKAQEAWHQAISNSPQQLEPYSALAKLYMKFEVPSHAAQVLKNAIENHPDHERHYRDLGQIYQRLNQYNQAIDILEKGFERNETATDFLFLLGEAYLANKDDRRAEVYFRRFISKGHPKEEALMVQVAQIRIQEIVKAREKKPL
jgi:tetratricopeptide (TPR) repeat protein